MARFEREVQSAARLSHPNTIKIYDYGHTDDGTFYYVMEYLQGMSLADMVQKDGPMPPGRVIYLFRQACAGLAEAHALGLVHRDVKPANLFVAVRGGESDVIKVLDFGLVKLTKDPNAAELSREMTVSGTPMYMAPEQAMGDRSLDARADIYALGAVMYYALTARPPFTGESRFAVMMAHTRDPVVPPSRGPPRRARGPRARGPDLHGEAAGGPLPQRQGPRRGPGRLRRGRRLGRQPRRGLVGRQGTGRPGRGVATALRGRLAFLSGLHRNGIEPRNGPGARTRPYSEGGKIPTSDGPQVYLASATVEDVRGDSAGGRNGINWAGGKGRKESRPGSEGRRRSRSCIGRRPRDETDDADRRRAGSGHRVREWDGPGGGSRSSLGYRAAQECRVAVATGRLLRYCYFEANSKPGMRC